MPLDKQEEDGFNQIESHGFKQGRSYSIFQFSERSDISAWTKPWTKAKPWESV